MRGARADISCLLAAPELAGVAGTTLPNRMRWQRSGRDPLTRQLSSASCIGGLPGMTLRSDDTPFVAKRRL
jgi:hypothetical protein